MTFHPLPKAAEVFARSLDTSHRLGLLRAAADRFLTLRGVDRIRLPPSLAPTLLTPSTDSDTRWSISASTSLLSDAFLAQDHALGSVYLSTQVSEERRRRLGIYYTPPDVVDLVLSTLLDPVLGERSPLKDIGLIDPACGCGAFLLRAYARLFAWFRERTRLPASEIARRLLTIHLHGVDVDPLAVEVSRLSLAARAAADGCHPIPTPLVIQADALLAPLPGPPLWPDRFTHVAGNPPFVEGRHLATGLVAALRSRFRAAAGKVNTACCFIERAFEMLAPGGRLGLVLPATVLRNDRYQSARRLLLAHRLEKVLTVGRTPFVGTAFDAALLFAARRPEESPESKGDPQGGYPGPESEDSKPETRNPKPPVGRKRGARERVRVAAVDDIAEAPRARWRSLPVDLLAGLPGQVIHVQVGEPELRLLRRIERAAGGPGGFVLGDRCHIRDGLSTGFAPFRDMLLGIREVARPRRGERPPYYFLAQSGERVLFDPAVHRPVIDGGEFFAWSPIQWRGRYVRYDKRLEREPPPPKGRPFNCQLRDADIFDRPAKVLTRQTARQLIATLDTKRFFTRNSVHNTYPKDGPEGVGGAATAVSLPALVAVLNGMLMNAYYLASSAETGRAFPQVHIARLRTLPIAAGLVEPGGRLERLALRRLEAEVARPLRAAGSALDRTPAAQHRVAAPLDAEMDQMICEAYGLSANQRRTLERLWRRMSGSGKKRLEKRGSSPEKMK